MYYFWGIPWDVICMLHASHRSNLHHHFWVFWQIFTMLYCMLFYDAHVKIEVCSSCQYSRVWRDCHDRRTLIIFPVRVLSIYYLLKGGQTFRLECVSRNYYRTVSHQGIWQLPPWSGPKDSFGSGEKKPDFELQTAGVSIPGERNHSIKESMQFREFLNRFRVSLFL